MYIYILKKTFCRNVFMEKKCVFNDDYPRKTNKLAYKPNIPSKTTHKIFVWTYLRKS